jgi:hypothetical protein
MCGQEKTCKQFVQEKKKERKKESKQASKQARIIRKFKQRKNKK